MCFNDKDITLHVNGRDVKFSKEELEVIVEKHLACEVCQTNKTVKVPVEGEWFEVNPLTIDTIPFEIQRSNSRQEATRKMILNAFLYLKNYPEKYGKPFETMVPVKTWNKKSVGMLKQLACELGDRTANRIEQAFEWAQRIQNGESWESICNQPDTANWYRIVLWGQKSHRIIGGCSKESSTCPPCDSGCSKYNNDLVLDNAVPLVVRYKTTSDV